MYTLTQIDTFIPPSNKNDWKIEADQKAVLANIPSSYRTNNYCSIFQYLIERYKPEKVIEFGVLGGYSTISIAIALSKLKRGKIIGYDLFEDYKYNSYPLNSTLRNIRNAGLDEWVELKKCNVFEDLDWKRIVYKADFLHVDLSNDGDVVEMLIDVPGPKVIVFEGGSLSRDEVDWMVSSNRKRMNPLYKSYAKKYKITTIQEYPSMTVVERGR